MTNEVKSNTGESASLSDILNDTMLYEVEETESGELEYKLDSNNSKIKICDIDKLQFNKVKLFPDLNNQAIEYIATKRMGFTLSENTKQDKSCPWFTIDDLNRDKNSIIIDKPFTKMNIALSDVYEKYSKNSEKRIPIQYNDILVSFKMTIGIVKIYRTHEKSFCNEAIDIVTIDDPEKYEHYYLAYIIGEKYLQNTQKNVGSTTLNDQLKDKIFIDIPKEIKINGKLYSSYQLQQSIAKYIGDKIAAINEKLEIIKKMKMLNEWRAKQTSYDILHGKNTDCIYEVIEEDSDQKNKDLKYKLDKNNNKIKICNIDEIEYVSQSISKNKYADFFPGTSPSSKHLNESREGYEFHQGKTYYGDVFLETSPRYTTNATTLSIQKDIIISMRAPAGEVNINMKDHEICIGRGLGAIRVSKSNYYKYIFYAIKNQNIGGKMGMGFTSIAKSDVENLEITVPLPKKIHNKEYSSLEIQRSIAKYIDDKISLYQEQVLYLNKMEYILQFTKEKLLSDTLK